MHVLIVRNVFLVLWVVVYSPTQLSFTTVLFDLLCTKGVCSEIFLPLWQDFF